MTGINKVCTIVFVDIDLRDVKADRFVIGTDQQDFCTLPHGMSETHLIHDIAIALATPFPLSGYRYIGKYKPRMGNPI